jgi:hypothetical protein
MRPTRGATLAGLVFIAVAAPVAAFALADDTDAPSRPSPAAAHDKADQKSEHSTGTEHADEASAPGRAHAEAMKAWAQCVAEAASGQKSGERTGPPKEACDDKPLGPGRAQHSDEGAESTAPGKSEEHKPKTHGNSHHD